MDIYIKIPAALVYGNSTTEKYGDTTAQVIDTIKTNYRISYKIKVYDGDEYTIDTADCLPSTKEAWVERRAVYLLEE